MTLINSPSGSDVESLGSNSSNADAAFYLVEQERESNGHTDLGRDDCHDSAGSAVVVPDDVKAFEEETVIIPRSFDVSTQGEEARKGVTIIQDDIQECIYVQQEDSVTEGHPKALIKTDAKGITFSGGLFKYFIKILVVALILCPYVFYHRERTLLKNEISLLKDEIKLLQESLNNASDVEIDNCWFNAKASMGMCSKEQIESWKEASDEVWDQFNSVIDWMNAPLNMESLTDNLGLSNPLSKSLLDLLYPPAAEKI